MPKRVILIQGAQAAKDLVDHHRPEVIQRWIVCDASAGEVLLERGVPFVDESYYLASDLERLQAIHRQAHQLSTTWFLDLDGVAPTLSATLSIRSWNHTFLSIFCAFHFLDRVSQMEGPCELIVAWSDPPGAVLAALLGQYQDRWGFKARLIEPLAASRYTSPRPSPNGLIQLASRLTASLHKGQVVLSGNPDLLNPVIRDLEDSHGVSCLRLREVTKLKQALLVIDRKTLLVPRVPSRPTSLAATTVWETLKARHTFHMEGVDFLPLVWPKILAFFQTADTAIRRLHESLQRILGEVRTEAVVVDEDVIEFHRTLVHAARTLGLKTLVVAHGLPGAPLGFVPLLAHQIAVWGELTQQALERWGVNPAQISITGCPKYDALVPQGEPVTIAAKRALCRRFQWDPNQPIALVLPAGFPADPFLRYDGIGSSSSEILKTTDIFLQVAKRVPQVNFIYKFRMGSHPCELFERLKQVRGGLPSNMQWIREGRAIEYLGGVDLVFNSHSSAGLEAVLLTRPVVNMNFAYHPDLYPFIAYGLSATVRTFEETLRLCQALGASELPLRQWVKSQEGLIRPFLYARDGRAAQRVAALIVNLLEEVPPGATQGALGQIEGRTEVSEVAS